mgnify:CR=1 FL=1
MSTIHPGIEKITKDIIDIRRDIHMHPELAFQEYRTAELITKELESYGLKPITGVGKTGVIADLLIDKSTKMIGMRADMDALPIHETGESSYKSVNDGVMHACGHDGHVSMLLGAARVLSSNPSKLKNSIRFIFQPAEEGFGGAQYMINDGALEGVDEIYGAHLWNYQPCGEIGIKSGPVMASADLFSISVQGKGGHGATPHTSNDAIIAASSLIQTFQTIVSRDTNPLESTVLTIGQINGGYNFNVIADNVRLKGTARAYSEKNRLLIKNRMNSIIEATEKMYNVSIELDYKDGYPPTINNKIITERALAAAKKVAGDNVKPPYLTMGGEDFSYFANEIPGCFFFIGSAPANEEPMSTPHHCSHFNIDENALLIGASTFVHIAEST